MELDDQTKRKIESYIGRSLKLTDKVSGLQSLPEVVVKDATQIASQWGGPVLAISYLRYVSGCTLAEAVEFLGL